MEINLKIDTTNQDDIQSVFKICRVLFGDSENDKVERIESDVRENVNIEKVKITQEELRMKLIELSKIQGKDVVKKMLADCGAEKLSDVKESSYNDLLTKIKEVM